MASTKDTAEAVRRRNAERSRRHRFRTHFQRWLRGEPVQSYDTRWLAYLHDEINSGSIAKGMQTLPPP